nr:MAG TPA: hypothetical protein [Caudoviricetes sp.]
MLSLRVLSPLILYILIHSLHSYIIKIGCNFRLL